MNWRQISEMKSEGIDIQPHSHSHPVLTDLTEKEIAVEIEYSKQEIEARLGAEAKVFCYPYGKYNMSIISLLQEHGFKGAVTTTLGWNTSPTDLFRIQRIGSHWFRKSPWLFKLCIRWFGSSWLLRLMQGYARRGKRRLLPETG
jgi:peptidoglycan/xylan/chitin deacetylase (PgdA/CDA1 family)